MGEATRGGSAMRSPCGSPASASSVAQTWRIPGFRGAPALRGGAVGSLRFGTAAMPGPWTTQIPWLRCHFAALAAAKLDSFVGRSFFQ
jgi:hypothetical protein